MFYALVTSGLHASLGTSDGISAVAAALASYLFVTSLALWVVADARHRQITLPYDYDAFVFFGWILAVPLYLWWTRRWRAFIPMLIFAGIYAAAAALSRMPRWL